MLSKVGPLFYIIRKTFKTRRLFYAPCVKHGYITEEIDRILDEIY